MFLNAGKSTKFQVSQGMSVYGISFIACGNPNRPGQTMTMIW
jgi:hypothetical protein